jgi:hypothetical protein
MNLQQFSNTAKPIDSSQVQQQLAALGYQEGFKVYLRAFFPSSDPRKSKDKGRKAEATNIHELVEIAGQFQTQGRGTYFVVNGGGHTDKDVQQTRAIFYEHDNLDQATQLELWKGLGLPEPTLQIDTGGKSIHSYWVFDEFVEVEKWRSLQTDLLEFADGDRALKNPSRVMRLAGAWHSSGKQSLIISNSGNRYSYEDLRAIVPERVKPVPTLFQTSAQSQPETSTSGIPETYEEITLPVPISVPLEACLAHASRDLLNGVSEGGRNVAGHQLACDLIGTANYLRAIGQTFDGDAESLFQDFGNRCNPALDGSELAAIWKSANSSNPSPACKSEGVENCIKGWYWNSIRSEVAKNQKHSRAEAIVKAQKMPLEEAVERARAILKNAADEISANIKLEEIRCKLGMSDYSWEHKFIKPLRRDMDAERFKLELLGLLQMEDAVERIRQIALLAPKYSMGASSLKEAMAAMKQRTQTTEIEGSMSLDDLFAESSEAMEWLVPGLLPVGETVMLCALPKVGKSKLAIDLAFCVVTGESKFLGQDVKQGKVLLITPDASKQSLKHELTRRGFRSQDSKNLRIFPRWNIDRMSILEAELEDFRPDLVVIDSLKKITAGKEISENSAEFADNIIALNDMLTRYRCSGILVHHANKGADAIGVEKVRGSTAIVGACAGVWMMERIPKKDPNNAKKLIVDPKDPKRIFTATSRDSEGTSFNIEFNAENNSWDFMGEIGIDSEEAQQQQSHRERILNILRTNPRELSGPEVMELLGVEKPQRGSIYSELGRMESKRIITSRPAPGDKRYNLYSLPKFNQAPPTDTVPPQTPISLPPPPPLPTVSVADYNYVTITQHGLDNNQQNSQQIVGNFEDCDSSEITENHIPERLDSIVSPLQLAQGGGGVECLSSQKTGTPLKTESAHSVEPIAPSFNLNEGEIELIEFIRACEDLDTAKDIQKVLTDACRQGYADRSKVWAALTVPEQSAFKVLLNSPQSEPELIAPNLEQQPEQESITPSESIAPPTVKAVKKARKEFKKDDRVIVAAPDSKIYKGAIGKIISTAGSGANQKCRVQFDKLVHNMASSIFKASQLMPEPISPASEELPKKP